MIYFHTNFTLWGQKFEYVFYMFGHAFLTNNI